ncbi:mechanosensitive ion channel family protein [Haliea sp. E17]|uniref:mechanosensitive ion channel family protein n=1 Tax=Haliea sp. E17 TaxID=3401576 RepID=UPI003AABC798
MRLILLALILSVSASLHAQSSESASTARGAVDINPELQNLDPGLDDAVHVASVKLDGATLFRLRGISAVPASTRVSRVTANIIAAADDSAIDPSAGHVEQKDGRTSLYIGTQFITYLFPADAALEEVPLDILAEAILQRTGQAISDYREARSPRRLMVATGVLLAMTLAGLLLGYAVILLFRWLLKLVERSVKQRIENIERASHRVIDAAQLWEFVASLLRGVRALALVAIALTWMNSALGLYPWTRPFATSIFHLVLNPLKEIGTGILDSLPDLAFLVILTFVVRFILKATKTFFVRVDRGWIRLSNFDRDWALPTYRILRILIVAFALVVAYPYIPGSQSDAFKGVSIFLGVVFSIGSSSFIANMIAGYSLTYRGAFREGDRVRIGEFVGEVVNVRSLSTQLRSMKNEDVNIPNSEVLASAVVNYSTFSRQQGIILHTDVGIGYDTPWRQVEAMLLMAAGRTPGLEQEPPPFVLQTAMGDFTVVYQLNAFCKDPTSMPRLYSALHANIQDVFNEYGVQIMSPNYEADPQDAKIVARENWYPAPAQAPDAAAEDKG